MLLATLKTKLQTLTGTHIGQVFLEWKKYLNQTTSKTYPVVLWSMDNAKFLSDIRTTTIQKNKEFTVTAFIIGLYDPNTQDKITVWDTLEGYFNEYLNKINANDSVVQIYSIDKIKGEYIPEGILSGDKEIGIMYTDIVIRTYCSA